MEVRLFRELERSEDGFITNVEDLTILAKIRSSLVSKTSSISDCGGIIIQHFVGSTDVVNCAT